MIRPRKTYMIHLLVLICFITAYLPVTQSWQIKYRSAIDLTDLVRSAALLFDHTGSDSDENRLAGIQVNDLMTQLKFATGQIKPVQEKEKSKIIITESMPEYWLPGRPFYVSPYPGQAEILNIYSIIIHEFDIIIDPPPPKIA